MTSGLALLVAAILIAVAAARGEGAAPAPVDPRTFEMVALPLIQARCLKCHGPDRQESDLRLDTLDGDLAGGKDAARWKEIRARLNDGEMPPKTEPRVPFGQIERVVAWIDAETIKADRAAHRDREPVAMRRLNRAEYANTVRDLLQVRFLFDDGPRDLLAPDGTADGFDKVGSALLIDPSLLDQYLIMARRVVDTAIVTGPRPREARRVRFEYEDTARSPGIGYACTEPGVTCGKTMLALMEGDARTGNYLDMDPSYEAGIPADGEYTIRVRMGADLGARGEPLKVQLLWPSVIAEWTLTARDAAPRVFEVTLPIKVAGKTREGPQVRLVNGTRLEITNDLFVRYRIDAEKAALAGDAATADHLLALAKAEGAASLNSPNPATADRDRLPKLLLDWIEIEGPLVGQWPPKSHREIFFEGPAARNDLAYARRIFARLMPRAYRRPVTAADVESAVRRVERELRAGETFEEAVKVGLEYVLCSPRFLYLVEAEPAAVADGAPAHRRLDDFELAARLSYFLWSTMPDEALTQQAAKGRLRSPAVLAAEVSRMLRDPKAHALVDGFAAEWLQAQKFAGIPPNRQIYKDWDDELEAAVKQEPLAFFEEILRRDLSATNFLDSDFAMLNARLARHYGVAGVEGKELRRVTLPRGAHRGGLVTQAAILTVGSDGTRTLPVRRASWILTTLFNSPPPPPPPNAGQVEPNIKGARLTVRERLLAHQKIPACASCHIKIDPYGLALESYDAVGSWRTRQNGEDFASDGDGAPAIVAAGILPDGRKFETTEQFRALLRDEHARFGRALTEKLLCYALGRSLDARDRGVVDALAATFRLRGYRLSALIGAIASSETFQSK